MKKNSIQHDVLKMSTILNVLLMRAPLWKLTALIENGYIKEEIGTMYSVIYVR